MVDTGYRRSLRGSAACCARAIADLSGVKRRILVHMGERPFNTGDGIEAVPVMHFAREVLAGRL